MTLLEQLNTTPSLSLIKKSASLHQRSASQRIPLVRSDSRKHPMYTHRALEGQPLYLLQIQHRRKIFTFHIFLETGSWTTYFFWNLLWRQSTITHPNIQSWYLT